VYELFYYPGNGNMAPHFLLEEIGAPFALKLVDRTRNEHKSAAFLKLNPHGLIPVLVDGETVLTETPAICLYLSDKHPGAALAPPLGTSARGHFYKWLMYLADTVHPDLLIYYYPQRFTCDANGADAVRQAVENRLIGMFQYIDDQLSHTGPYLMGEHFSLVDYYLLMLARWARGLKTPPRQMPHLARMLDLVCARPAAQRVIATEGLAEPVY